MCVCVCAREREREREREVLAVSVKGWKGRKRDSRTSLLLQGKGNVEKINDKVRFHRRVNVCVGVCVCERMEKEKKDSRTSLLL